MFSQNSNSQNQQEMTFIPVVLTLVSGEAVKGAIAIRKNGRLGDLLNGPDRFVLFKTNSQEPVYLAQNSIAAVQSNELPKTRQLDAALKQLAHASPHSILEVEPGIDKVQLRNAYHEMVKTYHPDQFANTTLPQEVTTYLDAVIQRFNAAYQQITDEVDARERATLAQVEAARTRDTTGTIRYFGQ